MALTLGLLVRLALVVVMLGGCYSSTDIDCRALTAKQSGVQYQDERRLVAALKECPK